jgi:thymidylate synthase
LKQYLDALQLVLKTGEDVEDRTGVGTRSVFGHQMRFNLQDGFPAVTTKKLAWRAVVGELLWFLNGSTDERTLAEITFEKSRKELVDKNTIWTANANKQAKDLGHIHNETVKLLGPVYGHQWRKFDGRNTEVDQIAEVIDLIKNDPNSRRMIVSAWNAAEISNMALPPCHTLFQFKVLNGKLSCQLYQRSADMFLGVPFNIASYALLTHMIAQICDLEVGEFIWTGGDCHIYSNHIVQVQQQLYRDPRELPRLEMPAFTSLEELLETKTSDYKLIDYNPMDSIKAPMAV